jgi:hypothetical protein
MPNSHPSHTRKKTGQHQSHPTILCTYPKEKGLGGESRENNSCGVNEWPFLLKNQKIVTCSIGLMYELAKLSYVLNFHHYYNQCLFSKDPIIYG